jgi:hypothetical protein
VSNLYLVIGTRQTREEDSYDEESAALAEAVRWASDGLTSVEVQAPNGDVWTIAANLAHPEPF